ncbi:hypothetical protein Vretifemale_15682, partial [Volvox reticuliferus]
VNSALLSIGVQRVSSLQIDVELLPCEVGSELVNADGNTADIYSCSTCRRDRVSLWRDRRLPLSELLIANGNLSHPAWQASRDVNQDLTTSRSKDGEEGCPSCCKTCPSNAICPGGTLLLPAPGYWHSAPNSPWMHRCPQPSACGKVESFGDELDGFWGEALVRNFNTSGTIVQNVTLNITDPSTVSIIASSKLTTSNTLLTLANGLSIGNNNRSLLLAVCQQWWYETYPPNRDDILRQRYSIQPLTMDEAPPCYLFNDPSAFGSNIQVATNRSYQQLQCATGYTGHLCAACLPGYSISADFSCMECPSLARTIVIGLLAFWGTVVLILFTTFSNMSATRAEAMAAEELSSLDVLKTLITHVQYFIIITKLGIDYPPIILKYQSVLSSFIGMENFIAYSPSCLFKGLPSAGQAATQIAFGFAAPCTATYVSLVLWTIRYLTANQGKLRRINAGRRSLRSGMLDKVIGVKEEGSVPQLPSLIAIKHQQDGAEISIHVVGTGAGTSAATAGPASIAATAGAGAGAGAGTGAGGYASASATATNCEEGASANAGGNQGSSQQQLPRQQQPPSVSSAGGGNSVCYTSPTSPANVASSASIGSMQQQATTTRSATAMTPEEDKMPRPPQLLPTPFASGAPFSATPEYTQDDDHCAGLDDRANQEDLRGGEHHGLLGCYKAMWSHFWHDTMNPLRLLLFADQSVSLRRQLNVIVIVASFILYPSLCQISLGIFACYKIDSASGAFKDNQKVGG